MSLSIQRSKLTGDSVIKSMLEQVLYASFLSYNYAIGASLLAIFSVRDRACTLALNSSCSTFFVLQLTFWVGVSGTYVILPYLRHALLRIATLVAFGTSVSLVSLLRDNHDWTFRLLFLVLPALASLSVLASTAVQQCISAHFPSTPIPNPACTREESTQLEESSPSGAALADSQSRESTLLLPPPLTTFTSAPWPIGDDAVANAEAAVLLDLLMDFISAVDNQPGAQPDEFNSQNYTLKTAHVGAGLVVPHEHLVALQNLYEFFKSGALVEHGPAKPIMNPTVLPEIIQSAYDAVAGLFARRSIDIAPMFPPTWLDVPYVNNRLYVKKPELFTLAFIHIMVAFAHHHPVACLMVSFQDQANRKTEQGAYRPRALVRLQAKSSSKQPVDCSAIDLTRVKHVLSAVETLLTQSQNSIDLVIPVYSSTVSSVFSSRKFDWIAPLREQLCENVSVRVDGSPRELVIFINEWLRSLKVETEIEEVPKGGALPSNTGKPITKPIEMRIVLNDERTLRAVCHKINVETLASLPTQLVTAYSSSKHTSAPSARYGQSRVVSVLFLTTISQLAQSRRTIREIRSTYGTVLAPIAASIRPWFVNVVLTPICPTRLLEAIQKALEPRICKDDWESGKFTLLSGTQSERVTEIMDTLPVLAVAAAQLVSQQYQERGLNCNSSVSGVQELTHSYVPELVPSRALSHSHRYSKSDAPISGRSHHGDKQLHSTHPARAATSAEHRNVYLATTADRLHSSHSKSIVNSAKQHLSECSSKPLLKFLIVSSNLVDVEVLYKWITVRGFAFWSASSVEQALAIWENQQCDVVIVDGDDLGEPAFGFAQQIRTVKRDATQAPTLILVIYMKQEALAKATAAGYNDVIDKPVRMQALEKKLLEWSSLRSLALES